ncbi:ankyrin repeat domain-containing protein 45-like [Sinocyclocheilus grahami]|uniref:ankyrin repeat domain-containing protein 45-like n=1 Tax=Sinocyclocheilus grahami TaxID=75366 RepID=UPI0007AD34C7|nr:PREDICTED: ankyrin repeat domain-containing protein 45-like [Sinocyclocheilus grahami]
MVRRYKKLDCAEYLAWAEAKQSLHALIEDIRNIIADPEKVQGKLNKEDKTVCINSCSAKSDWIHNTKNATIQDFMEQKKHLEDILAPVLLKLNTQSEATTKTRKPQNYIAPRHYAVQITINLFRKIGYIYSIHVLHLDFSKIYN